VSIFGGKKLEPEIAARIPAGQSLTERFPVLHYGPVPRTDLAKWDFKIFGLVDEPLRWNWEEFTSLPTTTVTMDIHCVTRWSKLDTTWEGVSTKELMKHVNLKPEAKFVIAHAEYGFTANMPIEAFLDDQSILAYKFDGKPLELEHGWPMRLVIPHKYFWKSAKWLRGLEFMAQDQLGFWERNGYNNNADPWKEERYSNDQW